MADGNSPEPFERPQPMTAGQRKFLTVMAAVLAVILAGGSWYLYKSGAFGSRPAYDQTWAYCEPGDRCVAIRAPCESWVAIAEKNLEDAKAYYDHMIALVEDTPQMKCASAPHNDIQPKAYCLSGLCMTAR
jgi:hypothetical protein